MKKYDAIFIINDRKFEDGGEAFAKKVEETIVGLGGADVTVTNMGRKQFARPIGKRTSGVYLRFFFDLNPDNVAELVESFRLENAVLRTVVYNYDIPENAVTLDLTK